MTGGGNTGDALAEVVEGVALARTAEERGSVVAAGARTGRRLDSAGGAPVTDGVIPRELDCGRDGSVAGAVNGCAPASAVRWLLPGAIPAGAVLTAAAAGVVATGMVVTAAVARAVRCDGGGTSDSRMVEAVITVAAIATEPPMAASSTPPPTTNGPGTTRRAVTPAMPRRLGGTSSNMR